MITWAPDLAVGIEAIDNQHKELYQRIDQLLEACMQGKGREIIGETLNFLEDYVITHFGNEEAYMLWHSYPGYPQHKAQHRYYIENLKQLKDKLATQGAGAPLISMTHQLIIEWLNNHIRQTDTQLARFLADKI